MPVKSFPRLTDGLAPQSSDLIDQLDQNIERAFITAQMNLEDPKVRAELAARAGARDLVDRLIAIRDKERNHGR